MSPSLTSVPLSSIDDLGPRAGLDPSRQNTKQMPTTPIDVNHLSAYSTYQSYTGSNSVSPSTFSTPAEQTSENSCFSEYDYAGDDEFFGVDFDAGERLIDANILINEDIPLPTTELPAVEAYLPQQLASNTQSHDTTTNSIHPTSSNQPNSPTEPFPKIETNELDTVMTAPQYERSKGLPTLQSTMSLDIQPTLGHVQRTPDLSPNSLNNGDNVGLGMGHLGHSPRVTITPWETMEETEIPPEMDSHEMDYSEQQATWHDGIQSHTSSGPQFGGGYDFQPSQTAIPHPHNIQHKDEVDDLDEVSGRKGIDPERRKSLSDMEIPNLKDQEKYDQLRVTKKEVDEWRSQAGDSVGGKAEDPNQSRSSLSAPSFDTRPRASTTSAIPLYSGPITLETVASKPGEEPQIAEGAGIEAVSDTASIRENQLKDGQSYFNINASTINDGDRELSQQSRHWNDGPAYPYATYTGNPKSTANDAIQRFKERTDNFSMLSRQATWGTRRRSEPSIADMESLNNGSFLKRLSFKTGKEKKPSIIKESIDHIANIVQRKRSDSKLKRNRSNGVHGQVQTFIKREDQSKLAPPLKLEGRHRRGASSPRLDTDFVGGQSTSYARSGSISATSTSPKGPLSFMGSAIRRVRSGSNLQQDPSKTGLVGMWKAESGGPPVPTLASPPIEIDAIKQQDYSDAEGEDDDEDEQAEEGEMMDFDPAIPITPNFNGFVDHVRQLYPQMEPNYLVERIAHQQVVRYKALLGWRVKHSGAIANGTCAAGPTHCITLGGSATLLEHKNQPRDSDMSNSGLQIMTDMSEGDSNPEGALAAESFPQGVPMPPTTTLPAEFECQLCFRVKKFQKPSDWTKHVHEDVQPFTCTYPNCKEPKSFKRKADWVRHENERHRRLTWWTCQVDECTHKCYRKDNFLQHLVREHKIPEPQQKSKLAAKKARNSEEAIWVMIRNCHHETAAKPQDEPCKFCGKVLHSWKKLTVHLAKHMEGISLSVLRLVEQQIVDANTIISPVEALPIRQTPVTPIGGDRRLSNSSGQYGSMSSSISPNTQSIHQFSSPGYSHTSPNVQTMPQFQGNMYNQNMGYNTTTTQDMSPYTVQAPTSQHMMFDNSGMRYGGMNQISPYMSSTSSRGFPAMDHSPSIDQSGSFSAGPVNGSFTPIQQQHGYHSGYASSNPTLSPDPSAAFVNVSVSAPQQQQMPAFQNQQSLTPNPNSFATSPLSHHGPGVGYGAQQIMNLGVGDEVLYDNSGLGVYDQEALMRAQAQAQAQQGGNVQYPSTQGANAGYRYHGHGQ